MFRALVGALNRGIRCMRCVDTGLKVIYELKNCFNPSKRPFTSVYQFLTFDEKVQ